MMKIDINKLETVLVQNSKGVIIARIKPGSLHMSKINGKNYLTIKEIQNENETTQED